MGIQRVSINSKSRPKYRKEIIGKAVIYLSDCRDIIGDDICNNIGLCITDPPYGINFTYNNYNDSQENLKELIRSVLVPAISISSRSLYFCSHKNVWLFPPVDWISCVSWNTTGSYGPLGICQWFPILFYGKDVAGFGSVNNIIKSDLISVSGGDGVGFRREEIIEHPCPKPLNIMAKLVQRYSTVEEKVLDLMMGSGTTGVAAVYLDRSFIGIENDPKYFDEACFRIEKAQKTADLSLFKKAAIKYKYKSSRTTLF